MPEPIPSSKFGRYAECRAYAGVPLLPPVGGKDAAGNVIRAGERTINADHLRCKLLMEKRADVGASGTVLDIENWYDCRIYYTPNPDEVISKALTALGYASLSNTEQGSFFDRLAADLEDAQYSSQAQPIIRLLNQVRTISRQGSLERGVFEESRKFVITTALDGAANLIKTAYPAVAGATDSTVDIIRNVVDISIATADYIAEYMAVRAEAARRYFSMQRRDVIQNAYRAVFGLPEGSNPSASTIAAWCRYGNAEAKVADSALAYLSAPDGTDGQAAAATAKYEAAKRVIASRAGGVAGYFKDDWSRFFGATATLAAWMTAYPRDVVNPMMFCCGDKVSYPRLGDWSIMRYIGASENENSGAYPLWEPAGNGDAALPRGTFINYPNGTVPAYVLPTDDGKPPKLAKVWWGNHAVTGGGDSGWTKGRSLELLRKAAEWMFRVYPPRTTPYNWFGTKGQELTANQPLLRNGYAADIWEAWKFWNSYFTYSFPYKGKLGKWEEARKFFQRNADRFFGAALTPASVPFLEGGESDAWIRRLIYATTGDLSLVNAVPRVGPPRQCPDGTQGCLPCSVLVNRLPIGAKSFPIPMVIEYSGPSPRKSPEFQAWARVLVANGYPGYYIDCIANDVTFKSKSLNVVTKGGLTSPAAAAIARNEWLAKNTSYTRAAYDGLAGIIGLTAPRIAQVGIAPTPPALIPELSGVRRPMTVHLVKRR